MRIVKNKIKTKRIKSFCNRYVNGTKGVISLFLAILMVPFVSIAGILINAGRINSAVAVFDEALCNASNSTLGTYDKFLKQRFGLLAMSQNTASLGSAYTVQDLISETFEFYMDENLKVLSNTYTESNSSAQGVYPLSDTDVLLSELLECSKYILPAKIVTDGLSINDIINQLTKSLSFSTSIFNTMSAGAGMADSLMSCHEKFQALQDEITSFNSEQVKYTGAYNTFVSSINEYNAMMDEMKKETQSAKEKLSAAQEKVSESEEKLDKCRERNEDVVGALEALENDKDNYGRPIDHTDEIEAYKEKHTTELKEYLEAREMLKADKEAEETASAKLQTLIDSYNSKLSEKKKAVTTAKSNYSAEIKKCAESVLSTGNAVVAAQSSVTSAVNSGVSFAGSVAETVYEGKKTAINNQIDDMKDNQNAAKERGDNTAAYLWQDQIDEAKKIKDSIDNEKKIVSAGKTATSGAVSELDSFASQDYQSDYSTVYSQLIELKNKVDAYPVPTQLSRMNSGVPYYVSFSLPVHLSDIQAMEENLAGEVASASFFSLIKALIGFIKSILTVSIWFDPELTSNINVDNYSGIGGLPSKKDRSEGSAYSLVSPFATEDSQKSEYYKKLLGAYSTNGLNNGSVSVFEKVITAIMTDLDTISGCMDDWRWDNIFSNLSKIAEAIFDIVDNVILFLKNVVQVLAEAAYQKLLLSGYIGYNTANRTTYTGAALTGKSFSLPTFSSSHQGLAFYGAETEYIMMGSMSEVDNQTSIFHIIYLLRLLYDIGFVLTNSEVSGIAEAAGAPTFGIGTVVVYVLYILAEPLVDAVILVNNGKVPVWKSKIYLTPSGIIDMVKAFFHMNLNADEKNKVYKQVVDVMSAGFSDSDFSQSYADAVSAFGTTPSSLADQISFNYTKTLIIMMMFMDSDTLLKRLSDIIQMECTYNATAKQIDTYTFDLDKSYTYLRASGSFEANEFIKLSNAPSLFSTERVIYRGY